MEHHTSHPLSLLHGGHRLQPTGALAYAWDHQPVDGGEPLEECSSTASELRGALLRALAELDAARAAHQAELRRVESEATHLAALVASAAAERDELRSHCHSLLLLLHHHTETQAPPPHILQVDEDAATPEQAELEMALTRRLPEKGRLVEAVVSAGPLLQTLLLAGPLPQWRHPPPPAPADIPPFNPGRPSPMNGDAYAVNSFSSASSSPETESNCSGGGVGPAPLATLPFHMSSFCM